VALKIVMDTNIFTAALISPTGSNRSVLRVCLSGEAIPLMGLSLFNEYEALPHRADVMKKCPIPASERQTLFEAVLSVCIWVKVYYLWRPNLPDEGDNHLVELALAGNASAIVTNNVRDLRGGELHFPQLHIMTPSQFLRTLK